MNQKMIIIFIILFVSASCIAINDIIINNEEKPNEIYSKKTLNKNSLLNSDIENELIDPLIQTKLKIHKNRIKGTFKIEKYTFKVRHTDISILSDNVYFSNNNGYYGEIKGVVDIKDFTGTIQKYGQEIIIKGLIKSISNNKTNMGWANYEQIVIKIESGELNVQKIKIITFNIYGKGYFEIDNKIKFNITDERLILKEYDGIFNQDTKKQLIIDGIFKDIILESLGYNVTFLGKFS